MINNEPPKVSPAGRYPIGKAAELLGVHRATLSRWIDEKRAKCTQNRQGRRYLTGQHIIEAWNLNA